MSDLYSVVALAAIVACSSVFEPGYCTFDLDREKRRPAPGSRTQSLFILSDDIGMRLWRRMLHEVPLGIMSLLLIMKLVLRAIHCGTGPGTCVEERTSFLVRRFEDENSRLARVSDDCLIAGPRQGSQPKGVCFRGQGSSFAYPVRLRGRRNEIAQ